MNFLYLYQLESTKLDIPLALEELGHNVSYINSMLTDTLMNDKLAEQIMQKLHSGNFNGVISFNFYPYVSEVCESLNIPYIAWLFDSPVMYAFTHSVLNKCNFIFCFDRKFCEDLTNAGIKKVYYMPLAANTTRLNSLTMTDKEFQKYNHDITFVGRLFQDNNFNKFYDKITPSYMEYFNQLFQLQYMTPNHNIFYNTLSENAINYLEKLIPNNLSVDYPLCNINKCYADIMLSRKYTELERTNTLNLVSNFHTVHMYTDSDTSILTNVINMGGIECMYEAPKLFYSSKINLNFTQITIETGLPLRVFDIMGNGGFLLSNAQIEFSELFTPGEEVILYHNNQELIELINYYLNHENERKEIAYNGYQKVNSLHTFTNRLEKMIQIFTAN